MEPVNVALLGCGSLAEILAERVYPALTDTVRVVAAVDMRGDRAGVIAERLGARPFTSLEAACSEVPVELVDVRLPHDLHLFGAERAVAVGKPVLVEKPMATNLHDARRIRSLGVESGLLVGVSENYGLLEPVLAARRLLDDGAIGELLTVRSARVFELGEEWRRDGWRLDESEASGVIADQATHQSRLLSTAVADVTDVHAWATDRRSDWRGEDSAVVNMRLANGVIGQQIYCWACPTSHPDPEMVLYGSRGSIEVHVSFDGPGGGARLCRPGKPDEWQGTGTDYYDSLAAAVRDFATALRAGGQPDGTSAERGVRDVAVAVAIHESLRTGESVTVESVLARP